MNKTKRIGLLAIALAVLMLATGCRGGGSASASSNKKLSEQVAKQTSATVPYPATLLTDSAERRNLREKLLRFNKQERVGYVYILQFAKVLGYYTIEGKVSSNASQMTNTQEIVQNSNDNGQTVIDSPQDDGSYGGIEPGVFFFTTEGALISTDANYIYSDQPIPTFVDVPKLNGAGKVADLSQRKSG